ncbi:hypothetical protein [Streptomyces sp. AcE210]|uniref:hypothetical protein n=1 Tax=Streptomyces sp. AcE210 TaxID=2292703 RepID=UPI00105866B2|nr:hypothetical protein [Streptomyces sp. AcE210]
MKQLDSLVRVLSALAIHKPDEVNEAERFISLWIEAEEPFAEAPHTPISQDPMDRAFELASSSGDATPIINLAISRPPQFTLEIINKLAERDWDRFTSALLDGLARRLDPERIPMLASLLSQKSDDYFALSDSTVLLRNFARYRGIEEICQLADLLMRAGSSRHAGNIVKVTREERPLAEMTQLLAALHSEGHGWSVGATWRSENVWPDSAEEALSVIRNFASLDYPEGIPDFLALYGSGHSSQNRWDLYQLLEGHGMQETQEEMVKQLAKSVEAREVAEFIRICDSEGDNYLPLKMVKDFIVSHKSQSPTLFVGYLPESLRPHDSEINNWQGKG